MKLLLEISTGKILASAPNEYRPGGEHGWLMDEGKAVWAPVPDGELAEDCDVLGGAVVVNATKKADRIAKADAKAARRATIKGAKSANSIAALRALVIAMAEDLGYEVDA